MSTGIWECKIGVTDDERLPSGADLPMRMAVRDAYLRLTGHEDEFCFSGWAAELTDIQAGIVEEKRQRKDQESNDTNVPAYRKVAVHTFRKDLENLINYHSKENRSNTPDFILADYLCSCLDAFDVAVKHRTKWYGEPVIETCTAPEGAK